jgi:hypothetical protein
MNMSGKQHPAVKANELSIQYAMAGDKEAWLALYTDDAVVQDPVGKSPMDPAGEGHVGKAAIAQFWDMTIGHAKLDIQVQKRWISGDRCCCVHQVARNELDDGKQTMVDMLCVYEVNDEGLLTRMSAHWDFDDVMAQLAP